jgi:hypothetical protein
MIAGADRKWYPGRITILSRPTLGLYVSHPMVKEPAAVRYAWDSWTKANLGPWHDPVVPYRSDDWPIVDEDVVVDPNSDRPSSCELRWLIERVIRLEAFPREMEAAVSGRGVRKRLAVLRKTLDGLQAELERLPDPEPMEFDTMLDIILPVMKQEWDRLIEQGVDKNAIIRTLSKNPF